MAEEEIIETEEATPASETATVEPHGSASAPRPGDRKYGNHKGRPSERRGGRGGLRRNLDNYSERVVAINRIAKTTKGGKNVRFSALAVVGDDKGKYGFALSKSSEVPDAIKKALAKARKQMRTIEVINGTIAHDVEGKFGATKVVLKPAPEGTGIVAGGAVRAIVELAGIKNLVAKVYGSRAPINVIRATDAGLASLMRYDRVMVLRGKKTEEQIRAARAAKAPKAKAEPEEKGDNE
jgi:small subunit ribosomal protein S5